MAFTIAGKIVAEVAVRSPQLPLEIPTITRAKPGHAERSDRLMDAMRFWGEEAAWLDHRIARLTSLRVALEAWLDRQPCTAWEDERYRRRSHQSIQAFAAREVAKMKLQEIAVKVDTITRGHQRGLSRLSEAFFVARQGPVPPIRPTQRTIEE